MTTNGNQWPKDMLVVRKTVGGADLDVFNNLATKVSLLTKQLQKQQGAINAIQTNPWEICDFCEGQHSSMECQSGQTTVEHAQFVARYNQQQQNTYRGNSFQNQGVGMAE